MSKNILNIDYREILDVVDSYEEYKYILLLNTTSTKCLQGIKNLKENAVTTHALYGKDKFLYYIKTLDKRMYRFIQVTTIILYFLALMTIKEWLTINYDITLHDFGALFFTTMIIYAYYIWIIAFIGGADLEDISFFDLLKKARITTILFPFNMLLNKSSERIFYSYLIFGEKGLLFHKRRKKSTKYFHYAHFNETYLFDEVTLDENCKQKLLEIIELFSKDNEHKKLVQ